MFPIAIVVFREILEIALILGVLLAATKGLPGRAPWVWLGLLLGILGAGIVAIFANAISQAAEGMGQEMMNAIILFIAAILIGWTVIWMNQHGRELAHHFKEVGKEVITGKKPKCTLTIVVALAVLREGSEIVMFIYSALVTGTKVPFLILGGVFGVGAGILAGFVIYYGLMKLPTKKIFTVTNWLLMLLVSGMVAQAFGFLSAAGKVPDLIPMVWDTSRFISEESLLGRVIHVLIGYTARPTGIQVLAYFLTLAGVAAALKIFGQPRLESVKKNVFIIVLAALMFAGLPRLAYAEKLVFEPYAEEGEWELENTGLFDIDPAKNKNAVQEYHYAVGYGVNSFWHTELELEAETEPTEDAITPFRATHMEWENILQLTQQGQYWLDAGAYLAYEAPLINKEVGQFEGKILLEKTIGKITNVLNINFNQEVGGGAETHTDSGISWSSKYRLSQYFEPGFEYWNDFSEMTHSLTYNQQSHQVGPVFYGHIFRHINYDIGYLFGISDAAPRGELKWIMEYEF